MCHCKPPERLVAVAASVSLGASLLLLLWTLLPLFLSALGPVEDSPASVSCSVAALAGNEELQRKLRLLSWLQWDAVGAHPPVGASSTPFLLLETWRTSGARLASDVAALTTTACELVHTASNSDRLDADTILHLLRALAGWPLYGPAGLPPGFTAGVYLTVGMALAALVLVAYVMLLLVAFSSRLQRRPCDACKRCRSRCCKGPFLGTVIHSSAAGSHRPLERISSEEEARIAYRQRSRGTTSGSDIDLDDSDYHSTDQDLSEEEMKAFTEVIKH